MKLKGNKVRAHILIEWSFVIWILSFVLILIIQWNLESKERLARLLEVQKELHEAHLYKKHFSNISDISTPQERFWRSPEIIFSEW